MTVRVHRGLYIGFTSTNFRLVRVVRRLGGRGSRYSLVTTSFVKGVVRSHPSRVLSRVLRQRGVDRVGVRVEHLFVSSTRHPSGRVFRLVFFYPSRERYYVGGLQRSGGIRYGVVLSNQGSLLRYVLVRGRGIALFRRGLVTIRSVYHYSLTRVGCFCVVIYVHQRVCGTDVQSSLSRLPLLRGFHAIRGRFLLFYVGL